jgi:hypothetical protein
LVDGIAANFGVVGAQSVQEDMHDWNGDWDILYPFSAVSKIFASYRRNLEVLLTLFFHTKSKKIVLRAVHPTQFMSPYKIPLPIEPGFVSPFSTGERAFRVEAVNDTIDVLAGTRSLTLEITHPGVIWTGE